MDRSEIITLISIPKVQNEVGVWVDGTPIERKVYCAVNSVSRAEFYEAGRSGLNPEYRMTMFMGDYKGESLLKYKGLSYSVYRTFIAKTDIIELYVERKGGTNAKP